MQNGVKDEKVQLANRLAIAQSKLPDIEAMFLSLGDHTPLEFRSFLKQAFKDLDPENNKNLSPQQQAELQKGFSALKEIKAAVDEYNATNTKEMLAEFTEELKHLNQTLYNDGGVTYFKYPELYGTMKALEQSLNNTNFSALKDNRAIANHLKGILESVNEQAQYYGIDFKKHLEEHKGYLEFYKELLERFNEDIKLLSPLNVQPKAQNLETEPRSKPKKPPITYQRELAEEESPKITAQTLFTVSPSQPVIESLPKPNEPIPPQRTSVDSGYELLKNYLDKKENQKKHGIDPTTYQSTEAAMEFEFKNQGRVYAQRGDNDSVNYSVSHNLKGQQLEETIKNLCTIAVAAVDKDAVFNLANCPEEKREATYKALTEAINQRFPEGKKPTIEGHTPPAKQNVLNVENRM